MFTKASNGIRKRQEIIIILLPRDNLTANLFGALIAGTWMSDLSSSITERQNSVFIATEMRRFRRHCLYFWCVTWLETHLPDSQRRSIIGITWIHAAVSFGVLQLHICVSHKRCKGLSRCLKTGYSIYMLKHKQDT